MLLAKEPLSLKPASHLKLQARPRERWRVWEGIVQFHGAHHLQRTADHIIFGACGAYAILRAKRGRNFFLILNAPFLMGLALPQQVAMVAPGAVGCRELHVATNIFGLILASYRGQCGLRRFFFSGFVNTVPVTLEEAAYIDGQGR